MDGRACFERDEDGTSQAEHSASVHSTVVRDMYGAYELGHTFIHTTDCHDCMCED